MGALQVALMVQKFQILANGDQRGMEPVRQIADQNAAIVLQKLQNFAPPLFIQHRVVRSPVLVLMRRSALYSNQFFDV